MEQTARKVAYPDGTMLRWPDCSDVVRHVRFGFRPGDLPGLIHWTEAKRGMRRSHASLVIGIEKENTIGAELENAVAHPLAWLG